MFFSLHYYKFFIATLVIMTMITGFALMPFTARATVPTFSLVEFGKQILQFIEQAYQSVQQYLGNLKEFVLDPVVKILVSAMIRTLTNAVINWIQSGGNTNFISNLEAAGKRVADEAAGEFLNHLAKTNLCQPFSINVKLLFRVPTLRDKLRCTATDIFRNLNTTYENFLNDFKNGGWIAFQTAMLPNNNYIDVLINSYDEKLRRESRQISILENQYQAGQGFVGIRIKKPLCRDIFDEDGNPAQDCTTQYVNTTPGTLVSDQLKKTFSAGWEQAVSADEIGEAIDAIIVAVVQKLISSAQAGLVSGNEASGILDAGFADLPPLPLPKPNLFVSEAPSPINPNVLAGDTVTFQGTIENNGGATEGTFNARFQVDINFDGTIDATLSPNPIIGGLTENGSQEVTSGPWTVVGGTHHVILCADEPNPVIEESLETDNCNPGSSGTVTVGPRPDLIVSENPSIHSGNPTSGSQITFKGTIKNQTSATASATFENRFEIDLGNDGSANVTLAPSPTIANLAADATQQVLSSQWTAVTGTHRVILCADTLGNTIVEANETNNCSPAGTGVFTISPF